MRSCFILGSGRSGTSLVAGVLGSSGYYMGDRPGAFRDEANPKGFFEDPEINSLNEDILEPVVRRRRGRWAGRHLFRTRLYRGTYWLSKIPRDVTIPAPPAAAEERIQALTSRRPFCFKDPRFSYTLPAWRRHADDAAMICVFREPNRTAQSIVTEINRADYLRGLRLDYEMALAVWEAMYSRVLETRRHGGDWLFVHYDQILTGSGSARIAKLTGAQVDTGFADTSLARSSASGDVPASASRIYGELCDLAQFPNG